MNHKKKNRKNENYQKLNNSFISEVGVDNK